MSREHWEQQAPRWAAWARRPDFDAYWSYSPAFFELVPAPGMRTLEVGCGEGRVSRDLAARGHRVTGVDTSSVLLHLAREAAPNIGYVRSDAAALPFPEATFDLAIFYNSLMDIDDMEGGVREAARVLQPGGSLCACVTHPTADAGQFDSREPDARFVIEDTYLGARRWFAQDVERDGLAMSFKGWAYSLEGYLRPLEQAGFAVQAVREPPMPSSAAGSSPRDDRWRRIPIFLMWRAMKT
jgi:SAM-dependent methyltransferase